MRKERRLFRIVFGLGKEVILLGYLYSGLSKLCVQFVLTANKSN